MVKLNNKNIVELHLENTRLKAERDFYLEALNDSMSAFYRRRIKICGDDIKIVIQNGLEIRKGE